MKLVAVACVLALSAIAVSAFVVTPENAEAALKFNTWKKQYNKEYSSQTEEDNAFVNFQASIERINRKTFEFPETQWALNKFSDLSLEQFKKMYLTHRPQAKDMNTIRVAELPNIDVDALPESIDWRTHKPSVVSPVKDQQQCGSCWAFSATENIESMWALSGRQLPILSPQQIVDCDNLPNASGCDGGLTEVAFDYVKQTGGLESEAAYPYQGVDQSCQFDKSKVVAHVDGYTYAIPPCQDSCDKQNGTHAMMAVAAVGPMAICVDASNWSDYSGGIFPSDGCSADYNSQDHCVQVVGYNKPGGYWIVRNSWNTDWGINGYIHLKLTGNACGILDDMNYANVPTMTADE